MRSAPAATRASPRTSVRSVNRSAPISPAPMRRSAARPSTRSTASTIDGTDHGRHRARYRAHAAHHGGARDVSHARDLALYSVDAFAGGDPGRGPHAGLRARHVGRDALLVVAAHLPLGNPVGGD